MNTTWRFATAQGLQFGRGSRDQLTASLARYGCQRPLVVSDPNVLAIPEVAELLEQLRSVASVAVFDQGQAEPSIGTAEAAILAGQNTQSDCVIGIGGGSNLDVAKMAALVLKHHGSPRDYFGFDRVPGPVLPIFALPTTAGTGSEVSHSSVLTDTEQSTKVSTLSHWLRPTLAIVDPTLTDSCPQTVTAHSGIDALVHAIESFTNRSFSEMTDVDPEAKAYEGSYALTRLLAGEAIRLIGQSLGRVVAEPANKPARDDMALAATLAGMAFSNSGVGIVHALEYPIGALTHCGHGEGNGLLLPHVMLYNLSHRQEDFIQIARWLNNRSDDDLTVRPESSVDAVVALQHQIGIRTQLRDLGLRADDIPAVAAKAFEIKRLMDINPRTPSCSDLESILRGAF